MSTMPPIVSSTVSDLGPTPDGGLIGLLAGNLATDPVAAAKYGLLFRSLEQVYGPVRVFDTCPKGVERLWNSLLTFHPNRRVWRERYVKCPRAFIMRSIRAGRVTRSLGSRARLVVQVGALFDAGRDQCDVPVVIYTDYTARLSADDPFRFRSPFRAGQLHRQIEHERQAYVHAAHVFTRSQLVCRDIVDRYGIAPERVTSVGGGVNLEVLPGPIERPSVGEVGILFIGLDFLRKGGDVLLRAFSQVRREFPQARLRVLTRHGVPADLPREGVEVVPYVWSRELLQRLYTEADLFVLPARLETWGDVILEAAAYGLPCIGTRQQAMQEIINDGETGLLVNRDNVEELATALRRLLGNDEMRRQLGAASRRRVMAEFTWDHVVQRMVPILDLTLASRRSTAASYAQ